MNKKWIIIILSILVIVATVIIYVFNTTNNNTVSTNSITIKNEAKIIELSNDELVTYNKELNTNLFAHILEFCKTSDDGSFNNGEFTDDEKINFSAGWASQNDKTEFEKNTTIIETTSPYTLKINAQYLINTSAKLFIKGLNEKDIVSKITDGKIQGPYLDGFGVYIAKVNKLILNENTGVYTLYYDIVNAVDDDENNSRWNELFKDTTTTYTKDEIGESFKLEFTKTGDSKLLKSLTCTYNTDK